jgi:hypothetical protein
VYKIVAILIFMVISLDAMTQKELAVSIDHLVRQSVRTQKMVKEALLIKMGIDVKANSKKMKFSVDMLNRDLDEFLGRKSSKNGLPVIKDKDILVKIKEFETLWREAKKRAVNIYSLKYTDDDIKYLVDNNLKLLMKNREAVLAMIKKHKDDTKLKFANDIEVASKQRMFLQMASKDILMYLNNINTKEALKDLKKIKDINRNFNALLYGDKELKCIGVKLPNIEKKIKEAQAKWNETKPLIAKALKKRDKTLAKDIIYKFDEIGLDMKDAVVLYTNSINKEKKFIALNNIINSYYNKAKKTKQLIDLAGKQRMLTQRIAKNAIECSYNLSSNSCGELEKDRKLYSNVLKLFTLAKSKKRLEPKLFSMVNDELDAIKIAWEPFSNNIKALEINSKDKIALNYILKENSRVLELSNNLVVEMLRYYKSQLTQIEQKMLRVVNLAGKERMLSQKMTKEYLEKNILNSKDANLRLHKTIKLYSLILNSLLNGSNQLKIPKVTNFDIKNRLKKIEKLWGKVMPIYLKDNPTKKDIKVVLAVNPILLKKMDIVVKQITKATEY